MRWTLKQTPDLLKVTQLAKELSVEKTLAKILVQRNIDTFDKAKQFFRPSLDDLHDPFLMKDMDLAVQRIEKAIANNENILVFGDYDVDGTTAVSLLSSYLKTIHPNIFTYIPDRYAEGYGVSYMGIDFADDNDFSLIIALDCGIKAIDKVAYAADKNIDFIICDHHKPGKEIPKAVAVLNPKQIDCFYPYDELCGCGVGFKLIQALASKTGQTIDDLIPYLDLVATAIAADIVPMTGENRTLTYFGLQVINTKPRNGIKAIIEQLDKKELTITDVVFIIAPRINAAGRMKHGIHAVNLLTEMDFDTAVEFASSIEKFNADRKGIDKKITQEALLQIEENNETERFTSVVFDETWHKGVIGIVASRLIETYYRPTLVFTKSGDKLAASARSVKGFDVYNALEQCAEFIEQFGGHKYAAGLTLEPEQYENFKNKFEEVVAKTIDKNLLTPEISIDAELDLSEISPKFFRIIQQMAPFGPLNLKPTFSTTAVRDNGFGKQVGADKTHLKLNIISAADKKTYSAIGFSLGKKLPLIKNDFDIAYALDENTWNGNTSIQLLLKDIK
ncbi:single-stranded-DNA-specific exonuclease RecJ [Tenacibaculum finnmarkense]|uniref:Single-stranded-DNA-specific exonuclease RecJ n=1 Tax=Tenacibaculum finnmarkense genomovar finnmarkense TaxID=1458503 RepID=A0AAP1WH48_9FLAO|nr:single-stranded-DNA-specific exonuclease RecJ [Tenacibaculum finnmarkense]MBE7653691.1 single-stranded-DNA-specific exonuclease RecJ [Tenacibaculum finnmarkense genomovar finnmarkense]MBE7695995.1 single-stranded-DNA-specific exonuclease RecJ [Tenacibaculum finnmarkense genomovar finnmarkense]MCD8428203.1 single-stranded-DNA-specific exonuclease RecJ [Tenacibaculum finnmarkense genomovar finnmarkense]MCD8453758.1 single-stranded-DNA-specific exonuclease RecJ [Tenacibaculum finnmarkense genom